MGLCCAEAHEIRELQPQERLEGLVFKPYPQYPYRWIISRDSWQKKEPRTALCFTGRLVEFNLGRGPMRAFFHEKFEHPHTHERMEDVFVLVGGILGNPITIRLADMKAGTLLQIFEEGALPGEEWDPIANNDTIRRYLTGHLSPRDSPFPATIMFVLAIATALFAAM